MDNSPTALFDSYSQDFQQLITSVREKLEAPATNGEQRKAALRRVEMELDEADEMVSQMEVEIQSMPQSLRSTYNIRVRGMKTELARWKKSAVCTFVPKTVFPAHLPCTFNRRSFICSRLVQNFSPTRRLEPMIHMPTVRRINVPVFSLGLNRWPILPGALRIRTGLHSKLRILELIFCGPFVSNESRCVLFLISHTLETDYESPQ